MAYDRIDPFGDERADMRAAQMPTLYANMKRGEDSEPFRLTDFMPFSDRVEPEQSVDTQLIMAKALATKKE
jgi:hypothetical protein